MKGPDGGDGLGNGHASLDDATVGMPVMGAREPQHDDAPEADTSEGEAPPRDDPEGRLLSREDLARLVDRLRGELSPLGLQLFHDLVVHEEPIASVAARTGMSVAAVQAWSSRLKRRIAALAAELDAEVRSTRLE